MTEELVLPTSNTGLSCIEKINIEKIACMKTCSNKKSSCINEVKIKAERVFPEKIKEYQEALSLYGKELEIYNVEQKVYHEEDKSYLFELKNIITRQNEQATNCKKQSEIFCDSNFQRKNKIIEFKKQNKPKVPEKPIKPIKPTIKSLTVTDLCNNNCNCRSSYNSAFISCGGKKLIHKTCIKNCD